MRYGKKMYGACLFASKRCCTSCSACSVYCSCLALGLCYRCCSNVLLLLLLLLACSSRALTSECERRSVRKFDGIGCVTLARHARHAPTRSTLRHSTRQHRFTQHAHFPCQSALRHGLDAINTHRHDRHQCQSTPHRHHTSTPHRHRIDTSDTLTLQGSKVLLEHVPCCYFACSQCVALLLHGCPMPLALTP